MKSILIALIVSLGFSSLLTPSANAKTPNVLWGYFQTTGSIAADNEAFDIPVARLLGKK
jgi:hypothetical protein